MLKLNEDVQTSSWKHDWHIYVTSLIYSGWIFFFQWQSIGKSEHLATELVPFLFFALAISIGLHRSAERRAQRRLQLLLEVIRGLQRREETAARP